MNITEFNNCVDKFSDNLFRFLLKSVRDEDVAQDIVQDSFEVLWTNSKKIKPEKAKSYLFSTGYHKMIDYIRKNKRISSIEDTQHIEQTHNEHYTDIQEILNIAITKLPKIQQSVILLRDYEAYSYKEIADITKISESQVKVYIYRARTFLKNYIVKIENLA